MSKYSEFFGSGKPIRVVNYTSGSGTFTPLETNSWCRVTLVGGGAGGCRSSSTSPGRGGGAGGMAVYFVRVAGATTYAVGAGGDGASTANTEGGVGGATIFGNLRVEGGRNNGSTTNGNDNTAGRYSSNPTNFNGVGYFGGPGGSSGTSSINNATDGTPGSLPAQYIAGWVGDNQGTKSAGNNYGGGGGGGYTIYGNGGVGGNGTDSGSGTVGGNATGAGGGGGGGGSGPSGTSNGGNGSSGLIIIEEFGAV